MKTLSNEHLHCREFGSALLDVGHLVEWFATRRLRCPVALPGSYVQVEWLLAAIQHDMQDSVTDDEAREIVMANSRLRGHRCANSNPAWLLGGEAYIQWAGLIREGVERGKLVLLDFTSKLPLPLDEAEEVQPWAASASTMAADMIAKDLAAGKRPTKSGVALEIARIFKANRTLSVKGKEIDASYIERALGNWTPMLEEETRKLSG